MSRAERMLDLVELLRAHDSTTIGAIAEELNVSRRTIFRDIAVLRERGWPIVSDPGPGGGVRLKQRRGVSSVHLASEEVVTLWVASRLSANASHLPWSAAAQSGLNKILSSLGNNRARELRRLVARVKVGRMASHRVQAELGRAPRELLPAFERAFTSGRCLSFAYTDRNGRETRRVIEPHGLLVESPAWYILGRDIDRGAGRVFRMDRIARPRMLKRQFEPDFETVWHEVFGGKTLPSPPRSNSCSPPKVG